MDTVIAKKTEHFFSQYPLRQFRKGQILIYGGDEPPGVFYLVKGEVRQYATTNSGDEVIVNVFKPSAFFPMTWAINDTPNEYFYETSTDAEMHIVPAQDAVKFIKENPDVTYDLLSRLYVGTDGLLRRMTHLMKGTAHSRTVTELIIACERFGRKQKTGYVVAIPEGELAARSGLTRETVSRELHKLHEKGVITVSHKNIVVKSLSRLEKELNSGL
jgi:CRP-like cAMP-binding protein